MKQFLQTCLCLGLMLTLVVTPSFGQEKAKGKGKKGDPAAQLVTAFMKQLEKAELSAEQLTKAKEIMTKAATEVTAKRTQGGITAEMVKAKQTAGKAAREAGKKGKDLQAALEAAGNLTDEQKKVYAETDAILSKARIEIGKLLSAEQIAKLPTQAQNSLKAKEGKKAKAK